MKKVQLLFCFAPFRFHSSLCPLAYPVWSTVVFNCTDFCVYFFIDCSGDSLRIESLTAFVSVSFVHCKVLFPLRGNTRTQMRAHVYVYKPRIETT